MVKKRDEIDHLFNGSSCIDDVTGRIIAAKSSSTMVTVCNWLKWGRKKLSLRPMFCFIACCVMLGPSHGAIAQSADGLAPQLPLTDLISLDSFASLVRDRLVSATTLPALQGPYTEEEIQSLIAGVPKRRKQQSAPFSPPPVVFSTLEDQKAGRFSDLAVAHDGGVSSPADGSTGNALQQTLYDAYFWGLAHMEANGSPARAMVVVGAGSPVYGSRILVPGNVDLRGSSYSPETFEGGSCLPVRFLVEADCPCPRTNCGHVVQFDCKKQVCADKASHYLCHRFRNFSEVDLVTSTRGDQR